MKIVIITEDDTNYYAKGDKLMELAKKARAAGNIEEAERLEGEAQCCWDIAAERRAGVY